MSRSNLSDETKVSIVLASFSKSGSVDKFCAENGIARSTFYAWRKALLRHLSAGIAHKYSRHSE
jgi:transposase-like protein